MGNSPSKLQRGYYANPVATKGDGPVKDRILTVLSGFDSEFEGIKLTRTI